MIKTILILIALLILLTWATKPAPVSTPLPLGGVVEVVEEPLPTGSVLPDLPTPTQEEIMVF